MNFLYAVFCKEKPKPPLSVSFEKADSDPRRSLKVCVLTLAFNTKSVYVASENRWLGRERNGRMRVHT